MFFSVSLSKDEKRLDYRMNPAIRFVFIFFLISLLLMFVFSFTPSDFKNAPLAGKINTFLLPFFVLLGSTYRYTVRFNKELEIIEIIKGFGPFVSRKKLPLKSLTAIVKQRVHSGIKKESAGHFLGRERFIFGFFIDGKLILVDRAARRKQLETLFGAFRAFFPFSYEIIR